MSKRNSQIQKHKKEDGESFGPGTAPSRKLAHGIDTMKNVKIARHVISPGNIEF